MDRSENIKLILTSIDELLREPVQSTTLERFLNLHQCLVGEIRTALKEEEKRESKEPDLKRSA